MRSLYYRVPGFGSVRRVARALHRNTPPLNFITLHYIYFVTTCMVASVIFWGASTPAKSVSYHDSLFLVVSAMTLAGLNTVNLSTLNTFQQCMLFFLIMLGSAIFVSAFVVQVRKRAFEKRFQYVIERQRRHAEHTSQRLGRSFARRLSRSLSRSDPQGPVPGPTVGESVISVDDSRLGRHQQAPTTICDTAASSVGRTEVGAEEAARKSIEIERLPSLPDTEGESFREAQAQAFGPSRNPSRTITYKSEKGDEIQLQSPDTAGATNPPEHITFGPNVYFRRHHGEQSPSRSHHHRFLSMQGVGAHANATIKRRPASQSGIHSDAVSDTAVDDTPPQQTQFVAGQISRNSQFHHLTDDDRERLGGYEYRAIRLLSWVVPAYFVLWQLLGCLGLGAYVAHNRASTARENGLNPWWVGAFNAVSAFNNSGMSLLDANMVAFQTAVYMLLTMGLLILAGNTCYPIFLRLVIWTFLKLSPDNESWSEWRKTLQFLLDHPRRCYTNMFPSQHTWWLLCSVVLFNGIDWAAFEILNLGNEKITSLPDGIEVIDGLFQAFAVRSGGFYVVPIPNVRISLQVLYVVMMYISVYPVVITMRNSNVYEERSLGIYADDEGYAVQARRPSQGFLGQLRRTVTESRPYEQTKSYFVRQQLRAQLAHDLWWVVLAIFLIMIVEGSNFEAQPAVFSVFNVIFEVISGYGCVGISVGLPDESYSFCGAWHTLSKLILCAVMIRGRHRGLPVAIDKAVLLPGEELGDAEEEDAAIRMDGLASRGRVV